MTDLLDNTDGLIVDWDGTVVDNGRRRLDALRQALVPYGLKVEEDWYTAHAGLPVRDLLRVLADGRELPAEEVVHASRQLLLNGPPPEVITATLDLLQQACARRIPRAVASSAAAVLVHTGIKRLGLDCLLPVVVTVESVARGKPAPDVYLEAARQVGAAPSRCLAVDDAPDGLAAARSAGMRLLTVSGATLVPVT
ncbi:HAD family hydrolase [Streptomyces griseoaurantiacus]|uniref:HAD family hydrolase n=1 Tax=Streptomyces griseoaurantiacus TaxID=68213 RepID=UPI003801B852